MWCQRSQEEKKCLKEEMGGQLRCVLPRERAGGREAAPCHSVEILNNLARTVPMHWQAEA